jgi:hypothetical protein
VAQILKHPGDRLTASLRVRQATQAGANDMMISMLKHTIDRHEYEGYGYKQHVFIVSMHVLGTAIRLGAHEPHPAPLGVPVMSINLGI